MVGYGYIAELHAIALAHHPSATLTRVTGRNEAKCAAFAARHGAKACGGGIEALVERSDVDAVIVATPNALHATETITALENGKHVLVEKPMATSVVDAKAMKRAAVQAGRQLMVGHMWRFDREAQFMRSAIERGEVGQPIRTHGWGVHVDWGPSGWFTDRSLAGGGALIDMGVHAIDTARYLLGDPLPQRVFAKIETRFGDYEVDDTAHVVIEWNCGVLSTIESGWWHPASGGPEASTEVFGTGGYARLFPTEIRSGRGKEAVVTKPEVAERDTHCDQHIYDGQLAAFVQSCITGIQCRPTADDGVVIMTICEAAYASNQQNRIIEL